MECESGEKPNLKFVKNRVYSARKQENEIYISRKRKNVEKFYYERAFELFFTCGFKEIFVCGMGACVNHAVKVALILVDSIPNVKIENTHTETVCHLDDYVEDKSAVMRKEDRKSNLIKIKLIKVKG